MQHPNVCIRIAYVGYRDHGDTRRFEIMPFVDRKPAAALRTFLEPVQAYGGGDGPEDVVGGVREAVLLDWKSRARSESAGHVQQCGRVCKQSRCADAGFPAQYRQQGRSHLRERHRATHSRSEDRLMLALHAGNVIQTVHCLYHLPGSDPS